MRSPDSDLELRLWRALAAAGESFERQQRVELDGGDVIQLDLACPECRLGIEVDHVTWHGGRIDVQSDKRRDRRAARVGWTMLRVTDDDIDSRLASVVDDIRTVHRARCDRAA
jgi:very-short-patch-repair endonuclease